MTYNEGNVVDIPSVDVLTLLFESSHCTAVDDTPLHAEASDPSRVITKSEARKLTGQIAHFLRNEYGVGKAGAGKDVVTTVSLGQSALPCLFFGVVAAEGVYSAASAAVTPADLVRQIGDGPSSVLVCSVELKERAIAAAEIAGLSRRNVLVLESSPVISLWSIDGTVRCDFDGQFDWRVITDQRELEESRVCILYTSGTTGPSKGVSISHANMVAEAILPATINRPIWEQWAADGNTFEYRTLAHLPPAHIAGVQGYFINPFLDGGIVYWMPQFEFGAFLAHCASLRITIFFSVPPLYSGIAKHPLVEGQFDSLRIAYSGAMPMSPELQAVVSTKFGGGRTIVSQTWGASETTGAVTHMSPDQTDATGSVSRLLPNMLMRLVDAEGNDVAAGMPGEALLKGPVVTRGYHNNPEANEAAFTADGWFRTGDVLRVENGLLYVVKRKMGIVKYKSLQVSS